MIERPDIILSMIKCSLGDTDSLNINMPFILDLDLI